MTAAKFLPMDPRDPVFHSFFEITTLANFPQAYNAGEPIFSGLYENNDPKRSSEHHPRNGQLYQGQPFNSDRWNLEIDPQQLADEPELLQQRQSVPEH